MISIGLIRLAIVLAFSLAATVAMADGGTLYAAFAFDWRTFVAYVLATVLFEAWFIGVRSGYGWLKSILTSIGVNLFSAVVCVLPELMFPVYAQMKPHYDPNPLIWMFQPLVIYALISGVIEGYVWAAGKPKQERAERKGIKVQAILAHLACIPISVAILVLPSRPFSRMEGQVFSWRMAALKQVCKELEKDIRAQGRVPEFRSVQDLIRKYKPEWLQPGSERWAIGYMPAYERFDTGERRRHPLEVNRQGMGVKVTVRELQNDDPPKLLWLIRGFVPNGPTGAYRGICVDLNSGFVCGSNNREDLGFLLNSK